MDSVVSQYCTRSLKSILCGTGLQAANEEYITEAWRYHTVGSVILLLVQHLFKYTPSVYCDLIQYVCRHVVVLHASVDFVSVK